MGTYAKVILDSEFKGTRVTTFELSYPRIVHGEQLTHRMLSRNASSSRAVPVKKRAKELRNNPFVPTVWRLNQAGMQPKNEPAGALKSAFAASVWGAHRYFSIASMWLLSKAGIAKELSNRLGEAHEYIKVVLTATEFDNYWELRDHPDAQFEIRVLAMMMREAYDKSVPIQRNAGDWHLPFVTEQDAEEYEAHYLPKISAARCARVSYNLHTGERPSLEKDLDLYNSLIHSKPMHASPVEHQVYFNGALIRKTPGISHIDRNNNLWSGNFKNCVQLRKLIEQGEFA